jgi:hypothetical protein
MEPVLGFEPRTDGLQNRCSTTELNWPKYSNDNSLPLFVLLFRPGRPPSERPIRDPRRERSCPIVYSWDHCSGQVG